MLKSATLRQTRLLSQTTCVDEANEQHCVIFLLGVDASMNMKIKWCQKIVTHGDTTVCWRRLQHWPTMTFVKAGAVVKRKKKSRHGILHSARNWIFDFKPMLITSTIPDATIMSREMKQIIVIELTAPLEEKCRKMEYQKEWKVPNCDCECLRGELERPRRLESYSWGITVSCLLVNVAVSSGSTGITNRGVWCYPISMIPSGETCDYTEQDKPHGTDD